MAENTNIEWCDHTMNFWVGCTKVSKACDRCYAAVSTPARTMKVGWGAGVPRHRTAPTTWAMPKRWNGRHKAFFAKHGRRQRVFALSLGDWLDKEVPISWLADMLEEVRVTLNLDWLLVTKRIGNFENRLNQAHHYALHHGMEELASWIREWLNGNPPANVWLGITVCDQAEADRDIPKLLAVPAAKRFLSMEPLLGPVDLWRVAQSIGCIIAGEKVHGSEDSYRARWSGLDWVIVGGESGPGARPMHPDWARSLRDQCQAAGVPYFFKQWGACLPVETEHDSTDGPLVYAVDGMGVLPDGRHTVFEQHGHQFARISKKAAGRLLDGRTWDEAPE